MELEVINPSTKYTEKCYTTKVTNTKVSSVTVQDNKSVMLSTLAGSTLGVWVSHGEGKFNLPMGEDKYNIVAKYGYEGYPANPNGSDFNTAMLCDSTGRHLVMMPTLNVLLQWNWALSKG
jgi:phosphoribosylformylglycinamidine synthase